jgi:hypothetical protein
MDIIDIAPIQEPKPRVISLEPISRRSRPRTARKRQNTTEAARGTDNLDSTRNGRVSELNSVAEESDAPGSPAPSDVSFESQFSSGNASGTEYGIRSVNTTAEGGSQNGTKTTIKGKTITATIDVLKGGFLRGDQVPIKISVNHTKHVRSLKGIIITLYRQARVDMHPALPVAPNSKGDKTKSEDYYPKSRTGLGGLSLSSAGSSHLFRKDLSQSFAPLFVDPRTLTAEVKCAVRVPDEAFPSISNVPGAMISFKYFIEVVVDIQGKLSGLDRVFPNAGLVSVGNTASLGQAEDAAGSTFSTWGGNFADTDALRREKGVISCIFEVVIGTKDSERNGKRKQQAKNVQPQPDVHDIPFVQSDGAYPGDGTGQDYYGYERDGQYYDHYAYDGAYEGGYYDAPGYQATEASQSQSQPLYSHPPANSENEAGISEKEHLRRAEARLLPSQPPGAVELSELSGPSSPPATQNGIPASAPMLPEEDDSNPPYFPPKSSPLSSNSLPPPFPASSSSHTPTAPSIQRRPTNETTLTINANPRQLPAPSTSGGSEAAGTKPLPPLPPPSPAVPGYFASSSSHVEPTDDKQELQRRRLAMETSAPPEDNYEDDARTQTPSAPPIQRQHSNFAPSAPVLDEDDEGLVGAVRAGRNVESSRRVSEALPVYER